MIVNHKENINSIKNIKKLKNGKVNILPFIPVKYAYKDIVNDEIFNNVQLFLNMLNVKIIPVRRFKHAGALYDNKMFININSGFPLFYVVGHEISHMLQDRYVDYICSMADVVPKYFIKDIEKIYDYSVKNDLYSYYIESNNHEFGLLDILFEIVGDVIGEFWLQYEFWELIKVDASDEISKLADLGISIVKKEKKVVSEGNSVLDIFENLDDMRYEIVQIFKRNLEVYISEL